MSDVLKFRSQAELEEEAAAWVWRLDDEDVPARTRAQFEQWLQRDPRHRRAFEELGGVWQSLDELAEAKRDEKVATFVAEERRLYAQAAPKHTTDGWRRLLPWAMAASLALATGGALWYQRGNESQTLSTAVGQQRSAALADGSVVQLNTNTIVETHFTRGRRVVQLEKGEALFKVAHDAERPFLVRAGDTVVRAVGTEFNVRLRDGHDVEVIVTEGRVEIAPRADAPGNVGMGATSVPASSSELGAGQRFETAAANPVAAIAPATVANTLAWREGAIVFDGEPLAQAIAELNRYTDTRLVVVDPGIQNLRVGGRFRTGDVDGFLEALANAFPVVVRRASDDLVYIEARASAASARR